MGLYLMAGVYDLNRREDSRRVSIKDYFYGSLWIDIPALWLVCRESATEGVK